VCDDRTRARLEEALPRPAALLIAVGSGVVSDLCKWLAATLDVPYLCVPTAASMNGYASSNIAPAIDGVKRVIEGTVPLGIYADPAVIRAAPAELTTAGLGDVLAKPVSMTDWRVNRLLFSEYYCPLCAELIRDLEPAYLDNPAGVAAGDPATLEALFGAVVYSGLSMTLAATSFPASGGEHLVSHVLDMLALRDGSAHDLHGRQVGIGAVFAAALYERLVELEAPEFRDPGGETDGAYWGSLADVVEEEHARKRRRAASAVARLREAHVWDEVRALAAGSTRPARELRDCLALAGGACRLADIGCSTDRFIAAVAHCHQIRERYTVIDLARAAGVLPAAAGEIVEEVLL
jgi:glycerol-1-phosphate dehydrogenase [NAD(P)+]